MKRIVVGLAVALLVSACSSSAATPPAIRPTEQPITTRLPTNVVAATEEAIATPAAKPTLMPTVAPVRLPTNAVAATEEAIATPAAKPTLMPTVIPVTGHTTGLGLTRADAARLFQLFEFDFELRANVQGQEVYSGTVSDSLATVTFVGPKDDIVSATVVIRVPKPPSENQASRTMAYLAALMSTAADDWTGGAAWLSESLNKMGESRTAFDSRDVVLTITAENKQTIVELTISAK